MSLRRWLTTVLGLASSLGAVVPVARAQVPAQAVPLLPWETAQAPAPAQPMALVPVPGLNATLYAPPDAPADPKPDANAGPACPTPPATDKPELQTVKFPFKWSWGGQARIEPDISNFPFHPLVLTPDDHTQRIVVERLRFWVTVNPNDNVEAYVQVQIGGIQWGSNVDFSKTFPGPRFPPVAGFTDDVGILLRRAWLAYSDDAWGKARAGFLDWHDSFGDTLASSEYDFQIGGVEWSKTFKECNNFRVVAAALFLSDLPLVTSDNTVDSPGTHTSWLFTLDADQPIDERSSVGGSVYFLPDSGDYS
jgi:hypothetical protein